MVQPTDSFHLGSQNAANPPSNNLLLALHTYASQQDENFTTKAFVHLLRHMKVHDPQMACALLRCVSGGLLNVVEEDCPSLKIETQQTFREGIPDILITSPRHFVIIEVKLDAEPGSTQLDRYRKVLKSRREEHRHLVLLSRYPVDPAETEKVDSHVRWHEIGRFLRFKVGDSRNTDTFLMQQFFDFLTERGMAMERVGWEFVRGIQSLGNLMGLLYEAIQSDKEIKKRERTAGAWHNGFYVSLNTTKPFLGVYYLKPQVVVFEVYKVPKDAAQTAGFGRVEADGKEYKWVNELDLESEDVHFFALSSENQQKSAEEFVAKSISAVKKISPIAATAAV